MMKHTGVSLAGSAVAGSDAGVGSVAGLVEGA